MTKKTHFVTQIPESHQLVLINVDRLDELVVTVKTKHGSGYVWKLETPDNNFCMLLGEHIPSQNKDVCGEEGINVYKLEIIKSGRLFLTNRRPFETDKEPLESIEVSVTVLEE